jgi:hypothetical protein
MPSTQCQNEPQINMHYPSYIFTVNIFIWTSENCHFREIENWRKEK